MSECIDCLLEGYFGTYFGRSFLMHQVTTVGRIYIGPHFVLFGMYNTNRLLLKPLQSGGDVKN